MSALHGRHLMFGFEQLLECALGHNYNQVATFVQRDLSYNTAYFMIYQIKNNTVYIQLKLYGIFREKATFLRNYRVCRPFLQEPVRLGGKHPSKNTAPTGPGGPKLDYKTEN